MTQVHFYHNAADPLALTCELVARAFSSKRRIAIRSSDPASADRLNDALWTFEPGSFIPHVKAGSPLDHETPVVLGDARTTTVWPHQDVLFNLATDIPAGFDGFRLVVEIVSPAQEDRLAARSRWAQYKSCGAEMKAFDAALREQI